MTDVSAALQVAAALQLSTTAAGTQIALLDLSVSAIQKSVQGCAIQWQVQGCVVFCQSVPDHAKILQHLHPGPGTRAPAAVDMISHHISGLDMMKHLLTGIDQLLIVIVDVIAQIMIILLLAEGCQKLIGTGTGLHPTAAAVLQVEGRMTKAVFQVTGTSKETGPAKILLAAAAAGVEEQQLAAVKTGVLLAGPGTEAPGEKAIAGLAAAIRIVPETAGLLAGPGLIAAAGTGTGAEIRPARGMVGHRIVEEIGVKVGQIEIDQVLQIGT